MECTNLKIVCYTNNYVIFNNLNFYFIINYNGEKKIKLLFKNILVRINY